MTNILRSRVLAVVAGALVVVGLGGTAAVAGGLVTSHDIKNESVRGVDLASDGVGLRVLRPAVRSELRSIGDGTVKGLESDGPYPGATDLGSIPGQGDNSDELVPADGARHTVSVTCAPGKVALGGGFRLAADNTQAAAEAISVLASEPTGSSIEGDPAGSVLPDGWQVEVVNNGTDAQVVRPWVVCADVS